MQSALMLGFNELLPHFPQALLDITSALIEKIPLVGIVRDEEQRRSVLTLLCDWGLPAHLLSFVSMPVKGMWVRDYGPSFVRKADGSIIILDPDYLEVDRPEDDLVPSELASLLKVPVVRVPMLVEGGNILSNGKGLCVTTMAMVQRNHGRHANQAAVESVLKQHYGFNQVVFLESLRTEPTCHVDMFATFTASDTIVVGMYDDKTDPINVDVLNRNADLLSRVQTSSGPLKVVRMPMPSNRGSVWRTYTNVIYANGTLLMPSYPEVDRVKERAAAEIYRKLLPWWEIQPIDADILIRQRGALRCISINIPWMDHVFQLPARVRRIA
jgi:agmatine deiminase